MKNHFFETPAMIRFRADPDIMAQNDSEWFYGIAIDTYVICSCCGSIVEWECIEEYEVVNNYSHWLDIEQELKYKFDEMQDNILL